MKILLNTTKTVVLAIILCNVTTTNAQFLKKLGDKIANSAKKTVEKKVEEKTERETNKAFDSTFNKTSKKKNSSVSKSGNSPSSSYSFTHIYTVAVDDGNKTTNLDYYLTPSANYFATYAPSKNGKNITTSIMDINQETMHMLMDDNKGNKSRMSMKLNMNKLTNYMIDQTNVKATPTGTTKTIVGYKCEGFKVKGDDFEGTVWVTQGAGISFYNHIYKPMETTQQDVLFKKLKTGLTLEMDMIDTSKRRPKTIRMTCIKLVEKKQTITTSNYRKMM